MKPIDGKRSYLSFYSYYVILLILCLLFSAGCTRRSTVRIKQQPGVNQNFETQEGATPTTVPRPPFAPVEWPTPPTPPTDSPPSYESPPASGIEPVRTSHMLAVNAPGFDVHDDKAYSVTLGWGVMDPNVVVVGNSVFTTLFYPCRTSDKRHYCVQILKNGAPFSSVLNIGTSLRADGTTPLDQLEALAYQPPLLFRFQGNLLLAFWTHGLTTQRSLVNLVSFPLAEQNPRWRHRTTYEAPTESYFNYLGGAMGPSGEIVIAGALTGFSGSRALHLIRTAPPYANWSPPVTVSHSTSANFSPMYPQVLVRSNGEVDVTFTIGHNSACAADSKHYLNYKRVTNYRGFFGPGLQRAWEIVSSDVLAQPSTNGDPCQPRFSRFPFDSLNWPATNTVFTVVRSREGLGHALPVGNHEQYATTFQLLANGQVAIANLENLFRDVFPANAIESIHITRAGEYFLFLASDSNSLAAVKSDLVLSTPPMRIPFPFGTSSPHMNQPFKNGSEWSPAQSIPIWIGSNHFRDGGLQSYLRYFLFSIL